MLSSIWSASINNGNNSQKIRPSFCLQKAAGQYKRLRDEEEGEEGGLALVVSAQPFLISFLESKTKTESSLHKSADMRVE